MKSDETVIAALREYQERTSDPSAPILPTPPPCPFVCPKAHRPPRMSRDVIALEQVTAQKRVKLTHLHQINQALRQEYEQSLKKNEELETFLKQIQFTFKNQMEKGIYCEAREARDTYFNIVKSKQACEIRQANAYLEVLRQHKAKIMQRSKQKQLIEDFNAKEKELYNKIMSQLRIYLENNCHETALHHLSHKAEMLEIQKQLYRREIGHKKKILSTLYAQTQECLLEVQGLTYEKTLLMKRTKDRHKETHILAQVQQAIIQKRDHIAFNEKNLAEKHKIYDYRQEWTKELKRKLQEKKNGHLQVKSKYQATINELSEQYQHYNAKYKMEIIEEVTNKKTKDSEEKYVLQVLFDLLKAHSLVAPRSIPLYLILPITKPLSLTIFFSGTPLDQFLQNLIPLEINLKSLSKVLETYDKSGQLALYLLQDTLQRNTIMLILKNLLGRGFKLTQLPLAKQRLKMHLIKLGDSIKNELKGQIDCDQLYKVMLKYMGEEYAAKEGSEVIEILMWQKYGVIFSYSGKQLEETFQLLCKQNNKQNITNKKQIKQQDLLVQSSMQKIIISQNYQDENCLQQMPHQNMYSFKIEKNIKNKKQLFQQHSINIIKMNEQQMQLKRIKETNNYQNNYLQRNEKKPTFKIKKQIKQNYEKKN